MSARRGAQRVEIDGRGIPFTHAGAEQSEQVVADDGMPEDVDLEKNLSPLCSYQPAE
jgi:hypothetical protein